MAFAASASGRRWSVTDTPGILRPIPDPQAEMERLAEQRKQHEAAHAEQQCVLNGGHCFVDGDVMLPSMPPQYPQRCKHCGKKRIATPREPYEYYYPEEAGGA